jgi:hypothetical protein
VDPVMTDYDDNFERERVNCLETGAGGFAILETSLMPKGSD